MYAWEAMKYLRDLCCDTKRAIAEMHSSPLEAWSQSQRTGLPALWTSPCYMNDCVGYPYSYIWVGVYNPDTNVCPVDFSVNTTLAYPTTLCTTRAEPGKLALLLEDASMLSRNWLGRAGIRLRFESAQEVVSKCLVVHAVLPSMMPKPNYFSDCRIVLPSGKCWVFYEGHIRRGNRVDITNKNMTEYASRPDWQIWLPRKRKWQAVINEELMARVWHPSRVKYWAHEDPELLAMLGFE